MIEIKNQYTGEIVARFWNIHKDECNLYHNIDNKTGHYIESELRIIRRYEWENCPSLTICDTLTFPFKIEILIWDFRKKSDRVAYGFGE